MVKSSSAPVGSIGAGFSPRIYPRPEYPPAVRMVFAVCKEALYQSGLLGLVITLALFPYYSQLVAFLRPRLWDGSDRIIFTFLGNLVHLLAYLIINGSFGIFDYYGFFQEYKLSRKPYMIPKKSQVLNTLFQAAVGQLVINPLAMYYLYPYLVSLGMLGLDAELPSTPEIFLTFCRAYFVNGIGFYCAHRLFHAKAIYAYFHKQHHEYTGSMGIAAEYAHPVEQIFANMLPTLVI